MSLFPALLTAGGAAVVLGLSADNMPFDGRSAQLFPFEQHVDCLIDLAWEGLRFVPEH